MKPVVGASHAFHDDEYVADWANRFAATPDRLALFDMILSRVRSGVSSTGHVVELGIGPGYLANHLLGALPAIQYSGLDFSEPMLGIAGARLTSYAPRISCLQADLTEDGWWGEIPTPVDAVVSTWALHDLGSQKAVDRVYRGCAQVLRPGGILLNGDFIKPAASTLEYEAGRFEIATHLAMLSAAGFTSTETLGVFEEELVLPTSAQNYACLAGVLSGTAVRG